MFIRRVKLLPRHCVFAAAVLLIPATLRAGTDVFVCQVGSSQANFGFINYTPVGDLRPFSVETFACNQGDAMVHWEGGTNQHPVIAQNMYRLKNGRFEQIGLSWLKHGFFAEQSHGCTACQPGGSFNRLGIGCCDAYNANLNGTQNQLGPRSEVNPSTGVFPYPPCAGGCPTPSDEASRRLQVHVSDLEFAEGTLYFMEAQYVTPDDCAALPRTDFNNASHRRISLNESLELAAWIGSTMTGQPAILAWGANDPGVVTTSVDVPGDGRYWIAAKVTDRGGSWRYEYAVQNLNSDRGGAAFTVPISPGAVVSNVGFHDVNTHSGEPYDTTDWQLPPTGTNTTGSLTWATTPFPADPPNANALRWGTLYNFRFDADVSPETGDAVLTLFKPGSPSSVSAATVVPQRCRCAGDLNGDGTIDGADIRPYLDAALRGAINHCADTAVPAGLPPDATDLTAFVGLLLSGTDCP